MNNEIKKILNKLNCLVKNKMCWWENYTVFSPDDIQTLLDYITNLQQKNERLNQDLSYYQGYGADMLHKNNGLEERIEKAVEFIKNTPLYEIIYDYNMEDELEIQNVSDETASNKLLNILNGRSDE